MEVKIYRQLAVILPLRRSMCVMDSPAPADESMSSWERQRENRTVNETC